MKNIFKYIHPSIADSHGIFNAALDNNKKIIFTNYSSNNGWVKGGIGDAYSRFLLYFFNEKTTKIHDAINMRQILHEHGKHYNPKPKFKFNIFKESHIKAYS